MPLEPKKITREHVLEAVNEIEENKIVLTPSTQWDVIIDGKAYPPKDVMRYAHKQLKGEILWDIAEGEATNTYLDELGFLIRAKNTRADQIRSIIQEYRKTLDISEFSNKDEKWYFVQRYKDEVDPTNPDFAGAFGSIKFANFAYRITPAVIKEILSSEPVRYQQCIIKLFNEDVDLTERIKMFIQEVEAIYRKMHPEHKNSSHHDERTIATFLTLRDPRRYTFFMDTFYRNFCSLMGIKPKTTKGDKYVHYLKYMHEFTSQYVVADHELISLASQSIPSDAYPDSDHLLLAQDIIFRSFGNDSSIGKDNPSSASIDNRNGEYRNPVQATPYLASPLNQILYGPPGTGKTYKSIELAVQIADPVFLQTKRNRKQITERYKNLVDAGRIVFCTFHQSMSYEDFIEGIKPLTNEDQENSLSYEVVPGIFKHLCGRAAMSNYNDFDTAYSKLLEDIANTSKSTMELSTPSGTQFVISPNGNDNLTLYLGQDHRKNGSLTKDTMISHLLGKPVPRYFKRYYMGVIEHLKKKYSLTTGGSTQANHVLIIDEINRGNVSQIFGELITLIESDKRAGMKEALEVTLPYSKEKFSVPPNLYIIGTMNTADRSVEALDTALRRRFAFEEIPPLYEIDDDNGNDLMERELCGYKMKDILKTLNKRIKILLDRDHQIGHSYFLGLGEDEDLMEVFNRKIIPLLQEYFYGDYARIGLVLGEGFVISEDLGEKDLASFGYDEADSLIKENCQLVMHQDIAEFRKALASMME